MFGLAFPAKNMPSMSLSLAFEIKGTNFRLPATEDQFQVINQMPSFASWRDLALEFAG